MLVIAFATTMAFVSLPMLFGLTIMDSILNTIADNGFAILGLGLGMIVLCLLLF